MLKKHISIIVLVGVLLVAGITADVFFWKHVEQENRSQQDRLQTHIDALSAQLARQQTDLSVLQSKLGQISRDIQQNHTAQSLDEIAYLLDVANLYLQINRDTGNAIKSLQLAEHELQTLADPALLPLRQAIASDLNSLNDAPKIDTADILLKLQTLAESINRLPFASASASNNTTAANSAASAHSKNRAWQTLQNWWQDFKNLFVIRKSTAENSPVSQENQSGWIRENIAFTLAQAQWAVLQQKTAVYQQSLTQVRQWVSDHYPDSGERQQILARIDELNKVDLTPALPDIHASLQAVQQALKELPTPTNTTPPANTPPPATTGQPPASTSTPPAQTPPSSAPAPEKTPPTTAPTGVEI